MDLYDYQINVARHLRAGKNVILQAPTGGGKTIAALWPYLEAWDRLGAAFPRKCIYSVPMRVLANQFVREARRLVNEEMCLAELPEIAIQTGEHSEDRELAASLTFATIDQVLSSFLLAPYSLPRRLSNLNAGAVASSYLVFDEFHLFDPVSTLPTTLATLRMLDGVAPFLLMTATFSADMLDGLARELNAVVVPEDTTARDAMQALTCQQKARHYHLIEDPLTADRILATDAQRSIAVCNVVDRAQALFEAVRDHPDRGDTPVLLLHSRFRQEDRARIEEEIRRVFGKNANKAEHCILVATQTVEVGLDITCQALHTELAPANAVVQRAGRCARYAGEDGDVYVYSQAHDRDGECIDLVERVLPYRGQEAEVQSTREALAARSGAVLTFSDEQEMITLAHGKRDQEIVQGLRGTQERHRQRMGRVMAGQDPGEVGNLVREVSSKLVVVHDDADAVLENPFAAEAFSLHPGTIRGLVKEWLEREGEVADGWPVQALHDQGDVGESGKSTYDWIHVYSDSDIAGAVMVLVHPALAGYDPEMGFLPHRGTGYRTAIAARREEAHRSAYSYALESYTKHARLVYEQFQRLAWPEMEHAAARLEREFGWPAGIVARAAHLTALLHDVGKLNRPWQDWVVNYQAAIGQPAPKGLYAHTDYDPWNPIHDLEAKQAGRKPPHAVEGAVAVVRLLDAAVGECTPVFRAAFAAIARHHGAFSHEYQRYRLAPMAASAVGETLSWLPAKIAHGLDAHDLMIEADPKEIEVDWLFIDPQADDQFLAYALLARALRRADQAGTAQAQQAHITSEKYNNEGHG
ncbi:MAG: CRISPR-associated helicase Cas3' [Anaerolineae bacterium]|nr:CRISPR-associated helicase Cas3' [Anaerolineae bacterium]